MDHPMFDKGVFTLSLDFELAWGSFDKGRHTIWQDYSQQRGESPHEQSRRVVHRLLKAFQKHDIAVTWAIVGHLFLSSCGAEGGVKHADMPRPKHAWFPRDWYALDPCGDEHSAPFWYARDLVEAVAAATPRHDVGSHSFSHTIFSDPGCTREVAEAELAKCVQLAAELGIEMQSFVFPRNEVGHLDLLPKYGFRCTRNEAPFWYLRLRRKMLKRVGHVLDDVLAVPPECGFPRRRDGVWVLPASMFLQSMDGARRYIPARSRVLKAVRGIERCIRERSNFHLLFHPVNMYVRSDAMFEVLDEILAHVARRRREGALEVKTMAELVAHCDAWEARSSGGTARNGWSSARGTGEGRSTER